MQQYAEEHSAKFAEHGLHADLPPVIQQLNEDELLRIIGQYEGVIAGDDEFTERVINHASRLRVISKWGVGIDNIALDAARSRGILVTNTPGTFADEVADVVVGYLVLLARQLHRIDAGVRSGGWPKIEGVSLAGKTLAIVGLGSIGEAVARRAGAMGMKVTGVEVSAERREVARAVGVELLDLDAALTGAHFVSLNCPLTAENRHMLSDTQFNMMRPGVFLVNTARGPLIEEPALIRAIETGKVAGAALDVFEAEPLPMNSPLREVESVILGAHNSSNTAEAARRVSELAVKNLLDALAGDPA
ncbi:MAG TPA: phosphoglycerate dehydrogenase [Candidatus Limnocylindria bacterium]|nr:phosphoglycerate dehydrogenase [Candidatus Limnocylindria bacterium]